MGLCLTYHVNLGLSLHKTAQALKDIYSVNVSHTMIANYAETAAVVIKPFVDNYNYEISDTMDAISHSIISYQVSDNRGVGSCILAMRMAFRTLKELPKKFRFIADGYSAYPLAAQQFAPHEENPLKFDITQVIGLTNDDAVSKEFRPFKQIIERLNRTFKSSYRVTCGYANDDGAYYGMSLWGAYYNFLRPDKLHNWQRPLNEVEMLINTEIMPGKWQFLIFLEQQTILHMQETQLT